MLELSTVRRPLRTRIGALLVALAAVCPSLAGAADPYPSRPIRIIVPFAPGGVADVVIRTVSPALGETLGQPIVVENKGGGGGTLGTALAAQAAPDGYTFVAPAASHTTTPELYTKLPFDPIKDFAAVTQIAVVPYLLVVNPSLPVNNLQEFIALAKSKPNTLTYGSAGSGSSNHLAGELFASMAGVQLTHTPYKGSGPALTDVMGGHLSFMFDAVNTSLANIKSGRLKALGVGTLSKSRTVPELPTISDSGLKGFEAVTWVGLLAPAGTPKEVIDRVNRAIVEVIARPDVRDKLLAQGAEPVGSSPAAFDATVRSELNKWTGVIRKAGIPKVQ